MHEAAQTMACGGGKEQLVEEADDAPFDPVIMRDIARRRMSIARTEGETARLGLIGPNAITQMAAALSAVCGAPLRRDIFERRRTRALSVRRRRRI